MACMHPHGCEPPPPLPPPPRRRRDRAGHLRPMAKVRHMTPALSPCRQNGWLNLVARVGEGWGGGRLGQDCRKPYVASSMASRFIANHRASDGAFGGRHLPAPNQQHTLLRNRPPTHRPASPRQHPAVCLQIKAPIGPTSSCTILAQSGPQKASFEPPSGDRRKSSGLRLHPSLG